MLWTLNHFEVDPVFAEQTEIRDDNGQYVCTVLACPSPATIQAHMDCGITPDDYEYETYARNLADARLIAAAPELLAALQKLCAAEGRMGGNNPLAGLCDEARELIARL